MVTPLTQSSVQQALNAQIAAQQARAQAQAQIQQQALIQQQQQQLAAQQELRRIDALPKETIRKLEELGIKHLGKTGRPAGDFLRSLGFSEQAVQYAYDKYGPQFKVYGSPSYKSSMRPSVTIPKVDTSKMSGSELADYMKARNIPLTSENLRAVIAASTPTTKTELYSALRESGLSAEETQDILTTSTITTQQAVKLSPVVRQVLGPEVAQLATEGEAALLKAKEVTYGPDYSAYYEQKVKDYKGAGQSSEEAKRSAIDITRMKAESEGWMLSVDNLKGFQTISPITTISVGDYPAYRASTQPPESTIAKLATRIAGAYPETATVIRPVLQTLASERAKDIVSYTAPIKGAVQEFAPIYEALKTWGTSAFKTGVIAPGAAALLGMQPSVKDVLVTTGGAALVGAFASPAKLLLLPAAASYEFYRGFKIMKGSSPWESVWNPFYKEGKTGAEYTEWFKSLTPEERRKIRTEEGERLGAGLVHLAFGGLLTKQSVDVWTAPQYTRITPKHKWVQDEGSEAVAYKGRILFERKGHIPKTYVRVDTPAKEVGRFFELDRELGLNVAPARVQVTPTIRYVWSPADRAFVTRLPSGKIEVRGALEVRRILPAQTKFTQFRGYDTVNKVFRDVYEARGVPGAENIILGLKSSQIYPTTTIIKKFGSYETFKHWRAFDLKEEPSWSNLKATGKAVDGKVEYVLMKKPKYSLVGAEKLPFTQTEDIFVKTREKFPVEFGKNPFGFKETELSLDLTRKAGSTVRSQPSITFPISAAKNVEITKYGQVTYDIIPFRGKIKFAPGRPSTLFIVKESSAVESSGRSAFFARLPHLKTVQEAVQAQELGLVTQRLTAPELTFAPKAVTIAGKVGLWSLLGTVAVVDYLQPPKGEQEQIQRSQISSELITPPEPTPGGGQAQVQVSRQVQQLIQVPEVSQAQTQIQLVRPGTELQRIGSRAEEFLEVPPILFTEEHGSMFFRRRKKKKKEEEKPKGYLVSVRRRGKFVPIFPQPLPKKEAIAVGAKRVLRTAAATFKLTPTQKPARSYGFKISPEALGRFRAPKSREPLVFVEKKTLRMAVPSAVREIQLARKPRNIKLKTPKLGRMFI